ncbi:MAG: hypothetical protein QOJ96_1072 [Alphaproteobacteria bacterium]|jgi:hypothetical protein|nr:hypothetical protein [Alphaproteobacteria bacterium]
MLSFDTITAAVAVPLWVAGAIAFLFILIGVMAIRRSGAIRSVAAFAAVAVVAIGAWTVWALTGHSVTQELNAERHALDARALELTARAIMPGSTLACLDANAGETVEKACERAVFASPEAVAAATSYMSARLSLLSDAVAYARRAERSYDPALVSLRRAVEADRFGLVAQVLTTRDACTPELCAAFALLRNADAVKANLKARTYENNVARYAAMWLEQKNFPAVAATPAPGVAVVTVTPSMIEFPSAASIPPVSIMNPEPAANTGTVSVEPRTPASRAPVPPPRRPATGPISAPPASTGNPQRPQ